MYKTRSVLGIAAVSIIVGTVAASAANFTGSPVADGWTSDGVSTNSGTYIRGASDIGNLASDDFSFNVYSSTFTLSSALGPFNSGDVLLGLGGVNNSGFILGPRIVAKFGSSGASFSASTIAAPGNGNGSFPTNSGIGGVEVAFWYQFSGNVLSSGSQNGGIQYPTTATNAQDLVLYNVNNTGTTSNLNAYGAVLANFTLTGGKDVLTSWEAVVDVTALAGSFSPVPIIGGLSDMALQETSAGSPAGFTDALIPAVIPEPSTYSLVLISVATFGWAIRRRRRANG
jgi:PEP-CTERM motif-containing protein